MIPAYGTDPYGNSFTNGQVPMPPGFVPPQAPPAMTFPPGYVPPQIPPIMPVPQRPPGCPPGLEYLTQVDQLLVHQKVELVEVLLGWETNNQYVVKNSLGQQVWLAAEESDFCTRLVCGPVRSFVMHLQDNVGQEVLTLTRPLKCSSCWFPCCLQELEVQAPRGTAIGYVMQDWHPYLPKFTIRDASMRAVLRIVGPFCQWNCCSDVVFKITSLDEASVIGRISKQWSGLETELFTDADNFGVQFPMDLDVKIKAVALAACFLIVCNLTLCPFTHCSVVILSKEGTPSAELMEPAAQHTGQFGANCIDLQPGKSFGNPNYGEVPVPPGYVPPQAPAMMPAPQRPPGCPPGLEYLTQIDQLLVHQQVELAEVILGWETNNKYLVKNTLGQQVFHVAEENDCCNRNCCGPLRSFVLHIQDNMGQEVITLTRPLRCGSCLCPCCLQELEVQSPPGNPIGYVVQTWHPCLPKYTIQNENKQDVLMIKGPCCTFKCCSDVNFEVLSMDETSSVGRISKQWSGYIREAFTDADNFGIKFPLDLDVKIKAVLLGALFLIDFMFFENKQNRH